MTKYNIQPSKTYKTEENAEKAIRHYFPNIDDTGVVYSIVWNAEGRCYPLFFGDAAVHHGVFAHFNVINF